MLKGVFIMLEVGTKLINKSNPEWGYWVIRSHYDDGIYEIRGNSGERILSESERIKFWDILED